MPRKDPTMPEPVPALILARLRRIARDAQRRHARLDPADLLRIINNEDQA